jgi:hypothetical protein
MLTPKSASLLANNEVKATARLPRALPRALESTSATVQLTFAHAAVRAEEQRVRAYSRLLDHGQDW